MSLVVLAENIYNIDETGVFLSVLNSLKVLVGRHELKTYKEARYQTYIDHYDRAYLLQFDVTGSREPWA